MTSQITETVFFGLFCLLAAQRRALWDAAHREPSICQILMSVAAHQGQFRAFQSCTSKLKQIAPKCSPGPPKSPLGGSKIVPGGSKISPGGVPGGSWRLQNRSLGGPRRLLESFQTIPGAPEGPNSAPRSSRRTILANFGCILE